LPRRSPELAWLVTGPLVILTLGIAVSIGLRSLHPWGNWPLALGFLALFIVADLSTLTFEVRRQTFTLTLVEIPLLLGLFYLAPLTFITVRILAAVVIQVRRTATPVKAAFNVALLATSAACATLVVVTQGRATAASQVGDPTHPRTWVLLTVAVLTTVVVSLAGVSGVITLVQGRIPGQQLMSVAMPGTLMAAVNTAVALVVLLALQASLWSLVVITALLVFSVLAYRNYARSLRQHRTLTEIYDLTRAISDTPHDGTLPDTLLARVRQLMQAEYATLWLPGHGRHPEVLLSARTDDRGLVDVAVAPESLRKRAVENGQTIAVGAQMGDEQLRHELRATGVKDAIVVPLRAGSAVIGTLEVAGRLGDLTHFGEADVRLLEAVAAHAAVAVENNRLVDRLRFDAYHDALTGLPNRRRLVQALDEAVRVRTHGEVVAILMFDVDGLRDVNDSLGHAAGDRLLAEVAGRLRATAPPAALVGRLGGDEFVVTLRTANADSAQALAQELRTPAARSYDDRHLDPRRRRGSRHLPAPDHGSDPAMLLQRADVATHAAKQTPNGVQLFDPALESRSVRRLGLAGDLRRALDNGELEVYFQPKVSLRDRRLVGVECLARWEHPTHGNVAPEDFVAVAEHTGQLDRLTEFVLREGLRRAKQWVEAGRPLSVAVNLSPRTLHDSEFPSRVENLLQHYGVAPDRLTLEITEDGVVEDIDRHLPTLRHLFDLGVRLAVDDFGTGYSSPVLSAQAARARGQGRPLVRAGHGHRSG
jgi:diguanylate cyclase (GGDEF)-like protein